MIFGADYTWGLLATETALEPLLVVPFIRAEDSTDPSSIIGNPPAIVCYMDAHYANEAAMRARFPHARILALTCLGGLAEGIDWEPGNARPSVGGWVQRVSAHYYRPAIYADLSDMTNACLPSLHDTYGTIQPPGRLRPYRIFTAHPNGIPHICGPHSCGKLPIEADGTQYEWHESYDVSALRLDFFDGPTPTPTPLPPEVDVATINWQQLEDGHLFAMVLTDKGEVFALRTTQPASFGPDQGPVWHGKPNVTSVLWESLGTPGK